MYKRILYSAQRYVTECRGRILHLPVHGDVYVRNGYRRFVALGSVYGDRADLSSE